MTLPKEARQELEDFFAKWSPEVGELVEEKEIYYNDKSLILSNILFIDSKSKRVRILQLKEKQFYK